MSKSSIFSNPITDFFYILGPFKVISEKKPTCAKIQKKFLDCVEAYGTARIATNCSELLYDMVECSKNTNQERRVIAIQKERMKKFREGKLAKPFEEHPPLDSYLSI